MRGPSSVSAVVSDIVPVIAPLVSVPVVALRVAAAAAPTTGVLLVRRLLRLQGPVPSVAPASELLLLPADTEQNCSTLRTTSDAVRLEARAFGRKRWRQEVSVPSRKQGFLPDFWVHAAVKRTFNQEEKYLTRIKKKQNKNYCQQQFSQHLGLKLLK